MDSTLLIYNTLSKKKETFEPIKPPHVGMYVCGPTVYGDPHLGHARPAITFDLVFRWLQHLDYKVRYVRNVTDVGHLENDADEGEDKIAKKARLEELEPMEVVQYYTNSYHAAMHRLNVLDPSIEPHASGHIIEQIAMIKKILKSGYAYESAGSVYFDVEKYNEKNPYGILSGRKVEELLATTRELEGQAEKKNSFDFALWKKAAPEHIMRWPSDWSDGFPGWHMECSAMGTRYLGEQFDIHGGGMDLLFPHHESEIAQSIAANGKMPVRYWMHNNMITINGQKMGKSLGNAVSLSEFFTGSHPLLAQAYSPMTIRFFILQAHYRGTLDFSNEALQAAEKGFERLMAAADVLSQLKPNAGEGSVMAGELKAKCYEAMNDDFNSPILIAQLFDAVKTINSINDGKLTIDKANLESLQETFFTFINDILGLKAEDESSSDDALTGKLIETLISLRQEAKANKDFATADKIRDQLTDIGITLKDTKDGVEWSL
ncbi:MAG TPA: cysteine--tRNA ligase [Bacteroidales bacterium]|nr:cysteine--tRNA ligase [Bacteroidales bacterium]